MRVSAIFCAAFAANVCIGACPRLDVGKRVEFTATLKAPACFTVNVPEGIPVQIASEQPEDVEIEARGGSGVIAVDAFSFGLETLTLAKPGTYQITLRPAPPAPRIPPAHLLLRGLPASHPASDWIKAEAQATVAKRSGKLEEAEKSLRLWKVLGASDVVARARLQKADALTYTGEYAFGRLEYEEVLATCVSSDPRCAAEAADGSGWASVQLGEFDPALQRLQEAAEWCRRNSDAVHEGQTLSNMGLLFSYIGDFRDAIAYYNQSASLLASRDRLAYARVVNILGLTYVSLAQYRRAQLWFRRAIAIESAQRAGPVDTIHPLLNLGRALMLEGDLNSAQRDLERALAAAMQQPNRQAHAMVLNNLGQVLRRKGTFDAAEARLNEALQLHNAVGDKRGAAAALHYLAMIARDRGDLVHARDLLQQAVDIRTSSGLRGDAADSLAVLADVEVRQGNYSDAQVHAEKGEALLESVRRNVPGPELRAVYYEQWRKFPDVLVDIAMRADNPKAADDSLLAAERGRSRSLLDLLAEGHLVQTIPAPLAKKREDLQREIDLLSLRLSRTHGAQQEEIRQHVESLLGRITGVEAEIRTAVDEPGFGKPLAAVEPWQGRFIPFDSAVLEYQLAEKRGHLWFVTPDGIRVFDLPAKAEIDAKVSSAVGLLRKIEERRQSPKKQAAFEHAMGELSDTLLKPLKDVALPQRLILVLDGSLNRVPFAALRVPGTKSALGLSHELIHSPSASYLEVGPEPRPPRDFPRTVLAIADPVFSLDDPRVSPAARRRFAGAKTPDLRRLPFLDDLDTIKKMLPESRWRVLKSFDANPMELQRLPLGEFGILHFSTHAIIDDQIPELSRVALSMMDQSGRPIDGFLHPHQLADWKLHGSTVVLSACDTALGRLVMGEGLMGLSSSLFHAGAGQLVLSLTEVDAQASAAFFSEVYRRVLGKRQQRMERALMEARKALARSDRWSDPYYWASFVDIGKPAE